MGIADPSAPYSIDQEEKYRLLINEGDVIQVGSGEEADYYMIAYARNKPYCFIITNDGFKDHKIHDNLKKRVIPVCIINDEVIFSKKLNEHLKVKEQQKLIKFHNVN